MNIKKLPLMSHHVYLVLTVRPDKSGGLSTSLDIYSEATPTTQAPFMQWVVTSARGKTFTSARNNLLKQLRKDPMHKWVRKYLM